jgi:hypothetical protein
MSAGRPDARLSPLVRFDEVDWAVVPDSPGAYVIYDEAEAIYVGMAGRDGKGSLRRRLRDHASGQIVNMFAQYLFLGRVQHNVPHRISHPAEAKAACRAYLLERCAFSYLASANGADARVLEAQLKEVLRPALNS